MTNLFSSTVIIMTMVELRNGLREIYLYVERENRYSEKYSALSRMADRHRPKVVVTTGQNAAKVVTFRISRMADRHCAEVIVTAAQILQRQKIGSAFSRMAERHRPEVFVTAGQNAA